MFKEICNISYLEKSKYYAIILQCISILLTLVNLILYYCDIYATTWEAVMTFYVPIYMMVLAICLWLHYFFKHEFYQFIIVTLCLTTIFMGLMVYTLGYVWPVGTIYNFETTEEFQARMDGKDPIFHSPFQPWKYLIPGSLFVLFLGASILIMIGKVYEEEFRRELGGFVIEQRIERPKSQRNCRDIATTTFMV